MTCFGGTTTRGFGGTTARGFGWVMTRGFEPSTAWSAIANRSILESFLGERGGWLWDTIEEGLGTYLYGFSEDVITTDSRLYGIHTEEYPITIGLYGKSIEEQGTRIRTGGNRGPPAGPTRGPPRVPFCLVPLDSSYFLLNIFSDKISYWNT